MNSEFDVIVVGGGGSGLAAAVSASEHHLRVLVLEKMPACGGTTGIAVGSFTGCETALQRSRAISDSVTAHAEDAGKFAPQGIESRNHVDLRRMFLAETATTLDWLCGMGVRFQGPNPEPPNRVPRMHNVVPGARAYITTLQARFRTLAGQIQCDSAVRRLVIEHGRVVGVEAATPHGVFQFRARLGVVLAAGDYSNSPATIATYKGPRFANIEGINPNATGDGHALAQQAGAKLINMDITYGPEIRFVAPSARHWLQRLPTHGPLARLQGALLPFIPRFLINTVIRRLLVTWQHPENSLFDHGAILLNSQGQRFCDEHLSPEREIAIAEQPQKIGYLLLDGELVRQYSRWPHFISTAPQIAYAYVADYERLRPDVTVRGRTLAEVATARGIPAAAVEATVAEYNRSAQRPLGGGPWVLLGPAKAWFTTTEGGAAVNHQLQVLNEHGEAIPGLYAVGQNGLGGQILWGHGLHIAWAITSGRLVGKYLASGLQGT